MFTSISRPEKPRKQQVTFTTKEDIVICEAHITITGDGSVATGQQKNRYWDIIVPLFEEKPNVNPNGRNKESLENRICTIKKEIKQFTSILGKLHRRKKSGWALEDCIFLDGCYELYKHESGYDYNKYIDKPPYPPNPPPV
ncbi:hypothetical protein MKX01_020124, partial [Papaver californicum]